jgi:hypothetical protein
MGVCSAKMELNNGYEIEINLNKDGIEFELIELASNRKQYDNKSKKRIDILLQTYQDQKIISGSGKIHE